MLPPNWAKPLAKKSPVLPPSVAPGAYPPTLKKSYRTPPKTPTVSPTPCCKKKKLSHRSHQDPFECYRPGMAEPPTAEWMELRRVFDARTVKKCWRASYTPDCERLKCRSLLRPLGFDQQRPVDRCRENFRLIVLR